MNRLKKGRNHKKTFIIITVLVLLLVGALLYKRHFLNNTSPNSGPSAEETKQASELSAQEKKELIDTSSSSNAKEADPKPTTTADNTVDVTGKIEDDNTVSVITKLTNIGSGTCNLTITNNANTYKAEAEVIYQPEFSTCAGFSVPIDQLGNGVWSISVTVNSGGKTYSKSISLEVQR